MLYPFDTSVYTTIGFISEGMQDFASAPVPVILGCHPTIFQSIPNFEMQSIESEVVLLFLDENYYKWNSYVPLPTPHVDYLQTKLLDLKNSLSKIKVYKNDEYIDVTSESYKNIKLQVMVNLEINMKIKKVFFNLILLLLNNYQDYYIDSQDEFDYEAYVLDMEPENQEFYHRFVRTQMFNSYIKEVRNIEDDLPAHMLWLSTLRHRQSDSAELSIKSNSSDTKTPSTNMAKYASDRKINL